MDRIRNLGFLLKDVSGLWVRYFMQHADRIGITLAHAKVLVFLSRNEGITQARLAELCDTDPMTLVRTLDRMQKDGWLERRPDPKDRRAYRLFLKPAADPVIAEISRIGETVRGDALSGISQEERIQLMALLERIHANLLERLPAANEPARANPPDTPATPATSLPGQREPLASSIRRRKASS